MSKLKYVSLKAVQYYVSLKAVVSLQMRVREGRLYLKEMERGRRRRGLMKTSVSLGLFGEDFGRRRRLLLRSLRLSQSRESRNCGIAKERGEERETHFRRETRIAFVASPEKGKGGRKDPFFFTRFSARGHASSGMNNNWEVR